jgi:ABC-type lipoprotein release transport system permease subunit
VGDKVVLMVNHEGEMASMPFRIQGIFQTGSKQLDGFLTMISLASFQEMVPGTSDGASQIAITLDGFEAHHALLPDVREAVAQADVEVVPWEEVLPNLYEQRKMDIEMARIIWPVLGFVVSIGVMNTLLMSLFERTRELGVMLALGMRPRQLFRLVLAEGAILGAIGSALGLLAGLALTWPAVEYGFVIPEMQEAAPVANVAFDGRFYAAFAPVQDVAWTLGFWLLATVAGAWPAYKASSADPVVSLRGN